MSKPSRVQCSLKSVQKRPLQKNYSLHHIQALHSKIQREQLQKKDLLQKMKQQKAISKKIGEHVNYQIEKVQNEGIFFASKIQQQRRKNKMLTFLVSYYQSMIYKDRFQNRQQMSKLRPNNQIVNRNKTFYKQQKINQQQQALKNQNKIQKYEEQIKHLRQLQKDLQQLIIRNNSSQFLLSKKLDQVRTLRSDRTIFNKIFDKLEKQLFDHEFQYQKLLVERTALENNFKQKIFQYELVQDKAEKQCQKLIQAHKNKLQTQRYQFLQQHATKRSLGMQISPKDLQLSLKQKQISEVHEKNRVVPLSTDKSKSITKDPENRLTYTEGLTNDYLNQVSKYRYSTIEDSDHTRIKQYYDKNQKPLEKKVNFKLNHSRYNSNVSKISNLRALSNSNRFKMQKSMSEQTNIQFQKKVKAIFQDLQIKNLEELQQKNYNLQQNIQMLYENAEQLYQKIYDQKMFIQKYRKIKQRQTKSGYSLNIPQNNQINHSVNQMQEIRIMECYIKNKQNLHSKILDIDNKNKAIDKQVNNFAINQVKKLEKVIQISKILGIIDKNKNQLGQLFHFSQDQFFQIMCQIDLNLNTIITDQLIKSAQNQNIQENQVDDTLKTIKSNKQRCKQTELLTKLNQTQRNTHKSRQSSYLSCNQSSKKDSQPRNKSQKRAKVLKQQQSYYEQQNDLSRLEEILKANRTTHNNINIYSQEELIEISKYNLAIQRKRRQDSDSSRQQLSGFGDGSQKGSRFRGIEFFKAL